MAEYEMISPPEQLRTQAVSPDRKVAIANIWHWTPGQRIAFRIVFIFLLLLTIPSAPEWWERTWKLDWWHLNYRDVYDLARFLPDVPGLKDYSKGLKSYNDWFVIAAIAFVGGLIWSAADRSRKEYNRLYYWLRVLVRYRAAIGMLGFGMQKVFPVQMAYPPISILNANFGDITMQKHYWWVIGISPFYETFTGFVELSAGLLLLWRKTTFWGAVLLVTALGSVNFVNVAYDGTVHVYSTYFVVYGLFLMVYYARDIYYLQFKESYTIPQHYYPSFATKSWRSIRYSLKALTIFVFVILLAVLQYLNFVYDPYNQPSAPGVKALRGYYNVTSFKLNGQNLPFQPLDSTRWQQVFFEKWSTMSFRVNMPIPAHISERMRDKEVQRYVNNHGFNFNSGAPVRDIDRTYEVFAANQRSFYYRADTVHHVLYLQDKATYVHQADSLRYQSKDPKLWLYRDNWISSEAQKAMFSEVDGIAKIAQSTRRVRAYKRKVPLDRMRDRMVLRYQVLEAGKQVLLSGINENGYSLQIVLDRVEKKYLLPESRLQGGKYN